MGLMPLGFAGEGFSAQRIRVLKQAYSLLFRKNQRMADSIKLARHQFQDSPDVLILPDVFGNLDLAGCVVPREKVKAIRKNFR